VDEVLERQFELLSFIPEKRSRGHNSPWWGLREVSQGEEVGLVIKLKSALEPNSFKLLIAAW